MLLSVKNSVRYVSQIFPLRCQKLISRKLHKDVKLFAEKLINRKVVRVAGDTSSEFLQGLITNDMNILQNGSSSIYSMFLNSKGRVLFDAIIFKPKQNNVFLIDCDSECYEQLIKHLKTYKLRRKIDITSLDSECHVWAIYNPELADKSGDIPRSDSIASEIIKIPTSSDNDVVAVDPRLPYLGYRAIITSDDLVKDFPKNDKYKLCRYKLGIGEGASELQIGQSFPLEINCDYLNGVSFDKGCYIGQELTARTFHTGVVRKRLMPLTFDEEPGYIPYNSSIDEPGVTRRSPLGKLKGVCERLGLGLMRVSETLDSKSLSVLGLVVKAVVPYWWPPLPQSQQNAESNK